MDSGCYTALITPFRGDSVDYEGLEKLIDFQIRNGVAGILAVGTTGESPTLSWREHNQVIETVAAAVKGKCSCIAGTGSNNTHETLEATGHAAECGADAVLLVDPYYNGPSSLEIRREYVAPVAAAFPEVQIIPYVVPGRTGAQLLPEDLALLFQQYPNVKTVKEATADIENMRRTRHCCGDDFVILSGDDAMTYEMMTDPKVDAAGVISVLSNIAPGPISQMVDALRQNRNDEAERLAKALDPLFGLVTIKTAEQTPFGEVVCRARNPLGIKTLMRFLGLPSGDCRKPLGKMSANGLDVVFKAVRKVHHTNPEILAPLAEFFNIDIDERLENPTYKEGLYYESY